MIAKTTNAQRSAAGKVGGRVATGIRWTCTTHGMTSSPCGIGNHQKKHDDCVILKPQPPAKIRKVRQGHALSARGLANIRAGARNRKSPKPFTKKHRAKIAEANRGRRGMRYAPRRVKREPETLD